MQWTIYIGNITAAYLISVQALLHSRKHQTKFSLIFNATLTSLAAKLTVIHSDDGSLTLICLKGRHILTLRTAR